MERTFSDLINEKKSATGYNNPQLARITGIPKTSIDNWAKGTVQHPREWRDIVKLAAALRMNESEASELLRAAGYPSVVELLDLVAGEEDMETLSSWLEEVRKRRKAPFQAIADIPHFVGRDMIVRTLMSDLVQSHHQTVYCIVGMGGTGKTVLAAHLAHLLRPYLADGILWARVDTSNAMSVLSAFAYAYGQDVSRYTELDSRSQVVRDILANKHALIVLDNVQKDEQIEHLLPPTGSCAVVITTRYQELWVTRAARRFDLGPFDKDVGESIQLFTKVLGEKRTKQERRGLSELAGLLGHLPLAVDIAASRMSYDIALQVAEILKRTSQAKNRLNDLTYGEQSVRLSFSVSYDVLPDNLQMFFANLGVFGGEDFGVAAVAYVSETPLSDCIENLSALRKLSLIVQGQSARYHLHPLMRDFAREKISDLLVYERTIEYFINYVESHEKDLVALDLEASNFIEALDMAFERGLESMLVRGVKAIGSFFDTKGLYDLAELHLTRAEQAARSLGDLVGLTEMLLRLGLIARHRGDYARAKALYEEGLTLVHGTQNPELISALLQGLGALAGHQGDYEKEEEYYQQGLSITRELGLQKNTCDLLVNLGTVALDRGDYEQSEKYSNEGLDLAIEIGDTELEIDLLINLGASTATRGKFSKAETYLNKALVKARNLNFRERIIYALWNLAGVESGLENPTQTILYLKEALEIARETGHRTLMSTMLWNLGAARFEAEDYEHTESPLIDGLALAQDLGQPWVISGALISLGNLYTIQRKWAKAKDMLEEALGITQDIGAKEFEAKAFYGLARSAQSQNNYVEAEHLAQKSLVIFEEIGHRLAHDVKQWLEELAPE